MVGLLEFLRGTQLYRRLEREGRLISDANGNNIDCNLSFVPRISAQRFLEEANFSAPAYFNGYVYFAAVNDTLKAFQLSNGLLSRGPPHTLWISSRIEAGRLRFQAMATLMASLGGAGQ